MWISKIAAQRLGGLSRRELDRLIAKGLLSTREVPGGFLRLKSSEVRSVARSFIQHASQPATACR